MGQLRLLGDPPRHEEAPPAQRPLSVIRDLSSSALTGGPHQPTVERQQMRIRPVGLCQLAIGQGELAQPLRQEPRDRVARRLDRRNHRALITCPWPPARCARVALRQEHR